MTETAQKVPDDPCKCGKYMLMDWWAAVTDAGNEGTDYKRHAREECLTQTERELRRQGNPATLPWGDVKDEWSDAIRAAFPTRSGSHEAYAKAMLMVGHRHSKGELVALVNWLLVENEKLRAEQARVSPLLVDE
jgi:hypothetical protein